MKAYRRSRLWQLGYNLALDIYPLLEEYPEHEGRNIVCRLRQALTSIPLTIGAGAACSDELRLAYLCEAESWAREIELLLLLSRDLGLLELDIHDFLTKRLQELLAELAKAKKNIEQRLANFREDREPGLRKELFL